MMYATPSTFTSVNNGAERWMIAPIPTATAVAWTSSPSAFPATVASPARRPRATDRLISNSTLGPGITIRTNAAAANVSR
jgi:hypothetical protein